MLLTEVAVAATVLFALAWGVTSCLGAASASVRRTIWRAVFVGVAALPTLVSLDPPQVAVRYLSIEY